MKKTLNWFKAIAMTTAVSAVIAASFAQEPPQGGPGQGGPGQGGPGFGGPGFGGPQGGPQGGMMRGPGGGLGLLNNPEVQQELKLTDDQKEKIQELLKSGRPQQGQGGPGFGGPGRGNQGQDGQPDQDEMRKQFEAMRKKMDALRKQNDEKLKKILSDEQYKRFHQIDLQLSGPQALLRPEVAEKLDLNDDQREQIQNLMPRPQFGGPGQGGPGQGGPGQGGPGFGGPGQGGPGQGGPGQGGPGFGGPGQGGPGQGGPGQGGPGQGGRGQGGPQPQNFDKQLKEILTDKQWSAWSEMIGKKFVLKQRPRQGGQGGPGFGGPGQGGPGGGDRRGGGGGDDK